MTATPSTPEAVAPTEPPPTDTPTPTASASPTPTATETATPTRTPTDTATPVPAVPKAQFVKDVTIPDGTVMTPEQAFTKKWRFKNVGAVPWGKGVKLVFLEGKYQGFESKKMGGPDSVDVPNVQPGKTVDVGVDLVAPKNVGHYRSYWRLQLGNGEWLEQKHYADIVVKLPGKSGPVPPGEEGGTLEGPGGETRWLPCGSPIPSGWTCTCNCVAAAPPAPVATICTCHTVCSCNADVCTCDSVHYWHPC